jgi:hypothetical protein
LAVSGTSIAEVASALQPGSWGEVIQDSSIFDSLACGGTCLHAGNRIVFSMTAAWDGRRGKLHFIGQDHGESYLRYVVYDAATNHWSTVCGDDGDCGFGSAHGYVHIAVDPITGTVYHKQYGAGLGPINVYSYPLGGPWSLFSTFSPAYHGQDGVVWWPGSSLRGADSGGSLFVYNCEGGDPTGQILLLSPTSRTWFANLSNADLGAGMSTYQCFAAYSPVHDAAVYGGGNANLRKLWRFDSDQSIHALADSPVDVGVNHGANVSVDPVSGNVLLLGGFLTTSSDPTRFLYELDPTATGRFMLQAGARVPPPEVANPLFNGLISATIAEHGAVLYVSCVGSVCRMFLYKHGPGNGA